MGWRKVAFILAGAAIAGSVTGGMYIRRGPTASAWEELDRKRLLEERAHGYWNAMLEKDVVKLADFVVPAERKKSTKWARMRDVVDFQLGPFEVDPDRGSVQVEFTFRKNYARMPILSRVPQKRTIQQGWTWEDRNWYLEPVERTFSGLAQLKQAIEAQDLDDVNGKEGESSGESREQVAWTADSETESRNEEEGQ